MARLWEFQLPTRVVFGRGAMRRLGDVARPLGSSALVVGYRDAPALEKAYARAARFLGQSGITARWFRRIDAEPDAELPSDGALLARQIGADVVSPWAGEA
jgi:alcohol dehydrogenase class IV